MKIPLWRLILSGSLLLLIFLGVAIGNWVIYFHDHTKQLLEDYSQKWGAPLTIGQVTWLNWHGIKFSDVHVGYQGDAVRVQEIDLRWHWRTILFDRRVDDLIIQNPQIWSGNLSNLLHSIDRAKPTSKHSSFYSLTLSHVSISRGVLNLDNLNDNLPSIAVRLGSVKPVEFFDLPLGPSATLDANLKQTAQAENISICSPFDPLTRVLHFETINLYFSWRGLANQEIDKLELKRPTIYLGPDLFWFTNQLKHAAQTVGPRKPNPTSWTIHNFSIDGGQLVISAFGDPGVTLPFNFVSQADEVHLDRFHELSVKNQIIILPEPIDYPKYNISIEPAAGSLQFDLPPEQSGANNLVQTIYFKRATWRGIEATDAWASFTFNEKGIYGSTGGKSYGGYMNSQFSIEFAAGYPWQASGYVSHVDAGPIVEKMTSDRFRFKLSGFASGSVSLKAKSTDILETSAQLKMEPPGHMQITELSRLEDHLPANWPDWQREIMKRMLASFKDYDYTHAEVNAHYSYPHSTAHMDLWGAQGHRSINIHWDQKPGERPLSLLSANPDVTGIDAK